MIALRATQAPRDDITILAAGLDATLDAQNELRTSANLSGYANPNASSSAYPNAASRAGTLALRAWVAAARGKSPGEVAALTRGALRSALLTQDVTLCAAAACEHGRALVLCHGRRRPTLPLLSRSGLRGAMRHAGSNEEVDDNTAPAAGATKLPLSLSSGETEPPRRKRRKNKTASAAAIVDVDSAEAAYWLSMAASTPEADTHTRAAAIVALAGLPWHELGAPNVTDLGLNLVHVLASDLGGALSTDLSDMAFGGGNSSDNSNRNSGDSSTANNSSGDGSTENNSITSSSSSNRGRVSISEAEAERTTQRARMRPRIQPGMDGTLADLALAPALLVACHRAVRHASLAAVQPLLHTHGDLIWALSVALQAAPQLPSAMQPVAPPTPPATWLEWMALAGEPTRIDRSFTATSRLARALDPLRYVPHNAEDGPSDGVHKNEADMLAQQAGCWAPGSGASDLLASCVSTAVLPPRVRNWEDLRAVLYHCTRDAALAPIALSTARLALMTLRHDTLFGNGRRSTEKYEQQAHRVGAVLDTLQAALGRSGLGLGAADFADSAGAREADASSWVSAAMAVLADEFGDLPAVVSLLVRFRVYRCV